MSSPIPQPALVQKENTGWYFALLRIVIYYAQRGVVNELPLLG